MKFQIEGKLYDSGSLDDLSLKYLLQLEKETADFGRPLNTGVLQQMSDSINELKTDKERAAHPDIMWMTAVSIWAARKLAGEQVTFEQAIDFPMSKLVVLPDPQDHKRPNPTKARSRKGSGQAANPGVVDTPTI